MPFLAFAYNTSKHESTGATPYELVYGRKPKVPLDLIIDEFRYAINREGECINVLNIENEDDELGLIRVNAEKIIPSQELHVADYITKLKNTLAEAYKKVISTRDVKVMKQKLLYDRNLRPFSYDKGDLVLREIKTVKKGLTNWFINGTGHM